MRTRPIGRNSPDKTVWWKGDLGGVYNIYNINILFNNYDGYVDRQRGRFAGFSLYVSHTDVSTYTDIKTSSLCYKDGPLLPSRTLQQHVQNPDVMSYIITNDWMVLTTHTDMKLKMYLHNSAKSSYSIYSTQHIKSISKWTTRYQNNFNVSSFIIITSTRMVF